MHRLTRHLRGLLVAIAALALSAGVVFAAHPTAGQRSTDKVVGGSDPTGQTLTVTTDDEDEDEDADEDTDEDADEDAEVDEDADEDANEDADAPEVDEGVGGEPAAERQQNHGWFVSQAAKGVTPASATSHGTYVSTIARSDAGKTAVTAKTPKAAKAANAANAAKAKSH